MSFIQKPFKEWTWWQMLIAAIVLIFAFKGFIQTFFGL